ncbi:hypothetical protein GCM10027176_51550 [Actinoallomurus bryophytorum]|uniref:S-adenosyl methyltransferase n=1 Tax=Actinoallomurus bryophytorum TaxID=1490222 RepID=A0A543CHM3_9ACTN|nr:SAM-dependent methyltransferase [Actinoallomurus bryophytorum]TQL96604.1 S-adenosyl methyltransferase [Actinoallomurus bryophytorum]
MSTEGLQIQAGHDAADVNTASPARMYDCWLGGKDNFKVDRVAAERVEALIPDIRIVAQENRAFLRIAVRYLVDECGIRQLVDIGSGLPTVGNLHEVAQEISPGTRVVYVDNDPIVLSHGRAVLAKNEHTTVITARRSRGAGAVSNSDHERNAACHIYPNWLRAETRHHPSNPRGSGLVVGGVQIAALPARTSHQLVIDDLYLQERADRMLATGMVPKSWLPASRCAVELGAQPRTAAWPSAFPGIGIPGCAPAPARAPRLRRPSPCLEWPPKLCKGLDVFLLFGPAYLRESQVAEIFGVSERRVADWYAAGLLERQHLFPFPSGYGYRRLDVVRLANTPGPVATRVREQMYRERKERRAGVSVTLRQSHSEISRAPH